MFYELLSIYLISPFPPAPPSSNGFGEIIGISTWFSGFAFLFTILTIFLVIFWLKKIGRGKTIIYSLFLGFGGFIFFMLLINLGGTVSSLGIQQAQDWLTLFSTIFISLLSFIIPIFIFNTIILLINRRGDDKKTHRLFISSICFLVFFPIIGILVALLFIPLIVLISPQVIGPVSPTPILDWINAFFNNSDNQSLLTIFNTLIPNSINIFASTELIGAVVVIGFIFGIVIKLLNKENPREYNSIINFFETTNKINIKYISYVLVLIPFVIATRIPILALGFNINNQTGSANLFFLLYYFVFFVLGVMIILTILISIIAFFSPAKLNEIKKVLFFQWSNTFANPSLPTLIPVTTTSTLNLHVSKTVSEIVPTLGSVMGLIICGGFTPTLLALLAASSSGVPINFAFVLTLIIFVIIISIGTSGITNADSIIAIAVLTAMGLSTDVYLVALAISPILEFLAIIGNSTGNLAAALLIDRWYQHDKSRFKNKTKKV